MSKTSRDPGVSLLQQNPSRELLLEKMRSKLATTPPAAVVEKVRKREVHQRATSTWSMRILMLLGFIAINYFVIGHKDTLAAKIGVRAVPSLPDPVSQYSNDDQAMYYVYALYDYPQLQKKFGVNKFFAVDQKDARRRLDDLLPLVSPQTLGAISAYMPVAFKTVQMGGNP